ncbi:MAG: release factor glutamine methyltransferase, partial [Arthrobacter sp.]
WIAAMLNRTGLWSEVTTHRDLNGKDRATSAVLAVPAPLADQGSQEVMKE